MSAANLQATCVSGGSVPTPSGLRRADILIEDGVIAAIGEIDPNAYGRSIDADGLLVLPAGVDSHVHLAMPAGDFSTSDDFESGSLAALRGGTCSLVDFVEGEEGEPLVEALDKRLRESASARTRVKLHMTVSRWTGDTEAQMRACVERGVGSFKIYLAYLDSFGLSPEDAFRVLEAAHRLGAKVLVHAEEGQSIAALQRAFAAAGPRTARCHPLSRPEGAEAAAAALLASFVERIGGPLLTIAHVSGAAAMREILAAKAKGLPIRAETCPHYLAFTSDAYDRESSEAALFVMSPPLRTARDVDFLWSCVADGSIDFISTDHCPFMKAEKTSRADDFLRIPNGVGGIAERAAFVLSEGHFGRGIPFDRLSEVLSGNAARHYGFSSDAGPLAPGERADLCLWNIDTDYVYTKELGRSRCDYSLYEGMRLRASPAAVLLDGRPAAGDWSIRS